MRNLWAMVLGAALLAAGPAVADGDAAMGEKVFAKCKSCHMVGDLAKNRVGPPLNGVVGRGFGAIEGFKYSKTMAELGAAGKVWDAATLDAYLTNPKAVVPKGSMSFVGLPKADDRANVIAYLKQFAADGSRSQ
jgi:cytochrome c